MKIMNENEKDFMEQLNGLEDFSVEEIAENFPALDENEKNRILKKCLRKSGLPDGDIEIIEETEFSGDDDDEVSVSGIERYNNISWRKYASSVAVMAVAVIGIASVVLLKGNLNSIDDFDISSPPVVSDSYNGEQIQVTEIVTGSYIDKGYRANGFDYANQNDYQGVIVGGTTAPPPPEVGHVVDESEVSEPDSNDNNNIPAHNQSDVPPATAPPATNPPVTAPPTTAQTVTTAPPVVTESQTTTALSVTEPTESTSDEVQKTFLSGLYYISFPDGDGNIMGMEFMTDGTLMWYTFSDYGTVMDNTTVKCNYEIIGNQFSFSDINNESDKRVGTILNPNDGGDFTVQFDDGIWNFSVEAPVFRITGVWYGTSNYGLRRFEIYNDTSGNFTYLQSGSGLAFEYRIENDRIYLNNGSADYMVEGDIISYHEGSDMMITWEDGTVESFYSEQQWLEMNQ